MTARSGTTIRMTGLEGDDMISLYRRIDNIERAIEAEARRSGCPFCGPEAIHMLWRQEDGRLRSDQADDLWMTDADGNPLCPKCGSVPARPVIVLRPVDQRGSP